MTSHDPDPLTPEERKLAARLARIGPHGMPSPALDARILGAAQAAAARKATARRQRRWPAWAGIAATLVLALGAVWQLRPAQEVPVALDEAPSGAAVRQPSEAVTPGEAPGAMDMDSGRGRAEQESSAQATAESPPPAREARAAEVTPAEPRAMSQPSPLPPAPVVFDEPSPIDAPAPVAAPAPPAPPPPPPPPPPPAQAQPAPAAATAPSRRYQSTPTPRKSTAAATMESAASNAPAADAQADAMLTVADLPVASDRLLAPADWIERIRQRRDAGDLAGARASLALLQRDHPQLVLPDDVRTIAVPAPDPDR